jgi:hypothetical protein
MVKVVSTPLLAAWERTNFSVDLLETQSLILTQLRIQNLVNVCFHLLSLADISMGPA